MGLFGSGNPFAGVSWGTPFGQTSWLGQAISGPPSYQPPAFNQNNYQVPNYQAFTEAGQNQNATNLANQNNQSQAMEQGAGALNSGSTGQALTNNLSNAQQANQSLANNVSNMQYNNAYNQYQNQVNAGYNQYQNQAANARAGLGTLGSVGGTALGWALSSML